MKESVTQVGPVFEPINGCREAGEYFLPRIYADDADLNESWVHRYTKEVLECTRSPVPF